MILVEKHQYTMGSKHYKELDNLCFLSKNLYNVTFIYFLENVFSADYIGIKMEQ